MFKDSFDVSAQYCVSIHLNLPLTDPLRSYIYKKKYRTHMRFMIDW